VISITTADTYVSGTVGRPLENLEIRLADDGEVQVRGESIMRGYWRDDEATAVAIEDGWLKTGDLGAFDADGSLRIVGRKKELLVLATGKKVAPTQVEQLLTGSRLIEQACVLGDGRNYLAAIIVPNGDALRREIRERRLWVWSKRRAVTHPKVMALYRREIDRCLSQIAHCEQIGQFVILPRAFSAELGELTAKLSLRREVIAKNFAREIERMYAAR
jgi:long-chain acyl-CoA synthetase